jgi:hypothetical protein
MQAKTRMYVSAQETCNSTDEHFQTFKKDFYGGFLTPAKDITLHKTHEEIKSLFKGKVLSDASMAHKIN